MNMAFKGVIVILMMSVLNSTAGINGDCGPAEKGITNEKKKDLFVSRGWGAGGIPYLESPYELLLRSLERRPMSSVLQERYRKMMRSSLSVRNRQKNNDNGGVIPQLFVSTGWGPNGRK